ncbi:hypothetical protein F511_30409 [Dorcoceras hygrometricum]|uniref:Splicing factor 3B subunit 1-like n=1 Tax=Dorcoceras hygrometricum TaxID=472368 RepID=A0A2Z7AWS3_9LAMI|nr:hypothetical protein F511_30409 [Dorcoceras hygrometricum]
MATSLIQNALEVNFDSVLSFPDEGMVQMFKALESTGLHGFLGCPSVLYEDNLVAFFAHGLVKGNDIISCVQGKFVGISEDQFAGAFVLPTEGLTSIDEVPKDLIYDARSIFSTSGEPIKTSCKKKEMKIEFCLLNDILAKSVTVKAGSFDAVTHERFLLMIAIHFGLKINWNKFGAPNLTLGEAKTFPPLKILTVKIVGTYVAKNKYITAEEATDEIPVKKVVKKAAAKRRPAPAAEPIVKRKHRTVGRAAPIEKNLALVPVVQDPEPIYVLPAESPIAQRHRAPKIKLILQRVSDDEKSDEEVTVVEETTAEKPAVEETVEDIVAKVIIETTEIEMEETERRIDVSAITNYDDVTSFKVLSNEEGPLLEKDKEKETEKESTDKGKSVENIDDSEDT